MCKRFCAVFLALTVLFLSLASAIVFVIDPFNHYRVPDDYTKIIYQIPFYQNVGIAKYAKFDTLITGTSMTQNFRANWFDEKMGCKAIRLSFDGGNIYDLDILLNTALEGEKIKTVYFGIDNYNLTGESTKIGSNSNIPEYLYDDNVFDDVNYFLNKDILFRYIRTYFAYKYSGDYNFYEMHAWDRNESFVYSKESVLKSYIRSEKQIKQPADLYDEFNSEATELLVKHVADNRDTKFVFFAPPYSILYWDRVCQNGSLDATISALTHTYNELLKYDNVEIYYFQNDESIITNLDIYLDYWHYETQINKLMLDYFQNGKYRVLPGDVEETMKQMRKIVDNYDFDALFENIK